jgi:hypothetical protein
MRRKYCLIVLTGLFSCQQPATKRPKQDAAFKDPAYLTELKFLNTKVEFGRVPRDTNLTARYLFVNTGKKPLIISSVLPDCMCTSYKLSNKITKPYDTGSVVLTLSTKEKVGPVQLYSTVMANTTSKMYALKIVANVK